MHSIQQGGFLLSLLVCQAMAQKLCPDRRHCAESLPTEHEAEVSETFEGRDDGSPVFCQPDDQGYFGFTGKDSYVVPYAYSLVTQDEIDESSNLSS